MCSSRFIRFILLAGSCLAGAAHAQVESLSLNFTKANWTYHNNQTGSLPFMLELVHGEEGSIGMYPVGGHNLTLKRGQFYPADPLPQAWLSFEMAAPRGQTGGGVLDIVFDQSTDATGATPDPGPHVKVVDGSNGTAASLHTGGANFQFGDGSVRFLRNSADVRLWGAPAHLFNSPGAGEPLEARLPTPAPGQTIQLQLKVMDDRGASMMLPVRIVRPR